MGKNSAIKHMNEHHQKALKEFCKQFGDIKEPKNVKLVDLEATQMIIRCNKENIKVPFLKPISKEYDYKEAIVSLYNTIIGKSGDLTSLQDSLEEFIAKFKSVLISSLNESGCVTSYAPFIQKDGKFYILISEVAEHFSAIISNPDKISIMFLEDEKKAKTIFARQRVSFKGKATIVDDEKDELFDAFEAKFPEEKMIKHLRRMSDFHMVEIVPGFGRYVKGFGAAYDTDGLKVKESAQVRNPHNFKKS